MGGTFKGFKRWIFAGLALFLALFLTAAFVFRYDILSNALDPKVPFLTYRPPPQWLQNASFGHQFTDAAATKPWPLGTDLNYSSLSVEEIQALLGLKKGGTVGAVEDGASQLAGRFGNVRRMVSPDAVKYLPASFNPKTDPKGPAANDMWAAIVNEVVWDGYAPDKFVGDEDSNEPRALVGLVLLGLARQKRIEQKLDKLLGDKA